MPVVRFHDFCFDSRRLRLTRKGEPCALRPKAAALLAHLVAHRERVVSKDEIVRAVWNRPFVSDATVFQTMSELRKALAPHAPITTLPNLGYRWTAPLRAAQPARRWALAAALAVIAVGATWTSNRTPTTAPEPAAAAVRLSPAMEAFALGLARLRANEPHRARHYFELALREHPGFVEARLLLSEALLAQGDLGAARVQARALIDSAAADVYASVAAMEVLSRTHEAAGDAGSALGWLLEATDRAREQGFACTVAGLEGQTVALMNPLPARDAPDAPLAVAATDAAQPTWCRDLLPTGPDAQGPTATPHSGRAAHVCTDRRTHAISLA